VVLHRLVDDPVAAHVLHELPGAGADRLALGALLARRLDMLLGLDERARSEQRLIHLVSEHHEGLLEVHGERVGVLDLHALDLPELRRQRVRRAVLGDGGEREPHVLRRHLGAVVEPDALAELELPRAPAVQDLPALGEHRGQLAGLGVTREEVFVHRLEHDVLGADIQVG
jgi:hypothetical protein